MYCIDYGKNDMDHTSWYKEKVHRYLGAYGDERVHSTTGGDLKKLTLTSYNLRRKLQSLPWISNKSHWKEGSLGEIL